MAKEIMTAAEIKDREAWLKRRENGIGGSDAAAIVGLNPYKSRWELWAEKTGLAEPPDLSDNEAVYFGTLLEDIVAQEFSRRTGKEVEPAGLLQDDEHPFLLASVDRLIVGEKAGLECKTAGARSARLWDGDEIPDAYYAQCLHYMSVTGAERWYIACLIGGQKFVYKTIERNEDDIKALREAEVEFWGMVQSKTAPDVDGSDSCTRILNERYDETTPEPMELSSEADALIDEIDRLNESAEKIADLIAEKKNRLREMLGAAEVGTTADHKITWRQQAGRTTIDSKRLKAEHPDIYAEYSKTGKPSRVLRIY